MLCDNEDRAALFGFELTDDVIKATIILLLALSVVLDLVCWKYRGIAMAIFYLECLWALFDAVLFSQDCAKFPVALIATRFIAIAVVFGTNARQTIVTTILFSASTHFIVQYVT